MGVEAARPNYRSRSDSALLYWFRAAAGRSTKVQVNIKLDRRLGSRSERAPIKLGTPEKSQWV
jgi:hypothetical protein